MGKDKYSYIHLVALLEGLLQCERTHKELQPEEASPEGVAVFAPASPALQGRRRGGTGRFGVKENICSTVREPALFILFFFKRWAETVCFFALYLIQIQAAWAHVQYCTVDEKATAGLHR